MTGINSTDDHTIKSRHQYTGHTCVCRNDVLQTEIEGASRPRWITLKNLEYGLYVFSNYAIMKIH